MHSPSLAPSVCSCSGYCHFLSLFLLLFPAVSEGSAYLSRTNMLTMPYKCLSTKIQINPHTKMIVFIVSTDEWSLTSSRRPERWPERCASNLLIYTEWSAGFLLHRPVCMRLLSLKMKVKTPVSLCQVQVSVIERNWQGNQKIEEGVGGQIQV